MKRQTTSTRLAAFVLAAALLLTSCGGGTAATMHLRKTEGTVAVSDGEGKDVAVREDLGLHSGYQVGTRAESYAWIDLDRVKLTKMDADSQVEVTKDGKKLEINVKSGSLFFNVTKPLEDDETMDIRTSTMAVGIRGTCGWVAQDAAALLEGVVEVTAGDQTATVTAGEMAVLTDGALEVKPLHASSVPAFVREEIKENEKLAETVQNTTGMDLTGSLEADYADVFTWIANEGGEVLFAEEIDFEADGSPELLVIFRDEEYTQTYIYRKGTGQSEFLCNTAEWNSGNYRISLVESEGRLCALSYGLTESTESYDYLGSLAQNDGDYSYWGSVDRISYYEWESGSVYNSHERDEVGLAHGGGMLSTAGEYEATIQKYTEVRVLVDE